MPCIFRSWHSCQWMYFVRRWCCIFDLTLAHNIIFVFSSLFFQRSAISQSATSWLYIFYSVMCQYFAVSSNITLLLKWRGQHFCCHLKCASLNETLELHLRMFRMKIGHKHETFTILISFRWRVLLGTFILEIRLFLLFCLLFFHSVCDNSITV